MDLEYDQKFEEMKKYIPFLESMIKRLETTNNGVKNPRKAQLDKIRSLRDLLLDKKKRMKMENLLKCEQVLVNLYAKVEQRDSMADTKDGCSDKNEKSDLSVVRNKLKSVVSKLQDDAPETLPEIARATNTEVVCTPGSKEPALFQRRPNKESPNCTSLSTDAASSKRHYTRVLMSPEHKNKEWSTNSNTITEKQLFSRRSPRISPKRYSPSYKKERKKSSRQRSKSSQKSKDLNITLKVPEESLGSLNTKDILSRIINCSDNDVDIETLRGLRSQILGELKQTGSKDDISELILKSYKTDKKKNKKLKKKDDVEEGELSDSESEAIENIYGSLVVVNEDESNSNTKKVPNDKKQPRKIQICLVINSDKDKDVNVNDQQTSNTIDISDFETYADQKKSSTATSVKSEDNNKITKEITTKQANEQEHENKTSPIEVHKSSLETLEDKHKSPKKSDTKSEPTKSPAEKVMDISDKKSGHSSNDKYKPNFYQPSEEENNKPEKSHESLTSKFSDKILDPKKNDASKSPNLASKVCENIEASDSCANVKAKKIVVSEIDILQALKKEILGETPVIPISETITPPLHQPKVTKVASASEIEPKKRISIENYKQKSVSSVKQPLFNPKKKVSSSSKDDNAKKQSLKLTEKECERFNFPVNISPVDSSDDENSGDMAPKSPNDKSSLDFDFLLDDSAPKSPDHEDFADTGIKPPVIIPSDPVKHVVPSSKSDIDMRTFPSASPVNLDGSIKNTTPSSISSEKVAEATWGRKGSNSEIICNSVSELRSRKESKQPIEISSPNSCLMDSDRKPSVSYQNVSSIISPSITSSKTPLLSLNVPQMPTLSPNMVSAMNSVITPILNSKIPLLMTTNMAQGMMPAMNPALMPNIIPNMNPSMTPNRLVPNMNPIMTPIMTPNARSYEMTPRPNFDTDDYTNQKHVYAPMFSAFDFRETNESNNHIYKNEGFKPDHLLDSSQARMECPSTPNPSFGRMECPSTPNPSFGRMDCPTTPNPSFGRLDCPPTPNPSFGRMDCPPTPNASFGRMDCPSTPNASFGRMDCPSTPNASFGRMDCPSTPNASFGRLECPSTPNPSFGRRESTPMTPIHNFGRSDCAMTPSHSYGRADANMVPSKIFGQGEYRKYVNSHDPRLNRLSEYDKYQGRNEERNRSYYEDDRNVTDKSNKYRSGGRSIRDNVSSRRELSVGRSKVCDDESYGYYNNDYQNRRERYKYSDDVNSRRDYRERNSGRNSQEEESTSTRRESSRNYSRDDSIEKPISVQSHSGRSFNIDTSFNRTFQETLPSSSSLFDDRRRRASSVGRCLRESPRKDFKPMSNNNNKFQSDIPNRKNMQFRRACSVGRDLKDYNASKNFNDIKADLKSCKFNDYNSKLHDKSHKSKTQHSKSNESIRSNECYGSQSKRVPYTSTSHSSGQHNRDPRRVRDNDKNTNDLKYSPRKNNRDPRMRREIDDRPVSKDKSKYKERNSSSSRFKNYGIVYSNDNIAKGTILASAAGVKNFKIPKLKRPNEEKEVENSEKQSETDTQKEGSLKNAKKEDTNCAENVKKVDKKVSKDANIGKPKPKQEAKTSIKLEDKAKRSENKELDNSITDNCDRRITRSANKVVTPVKQISDTSPIRKLKRIKKPFVYDSDSDTQENDNNVNLKKDFKESKNIETVNTVTLKKVSKSEKTKILLDIPLIENNINSDSSSTKEIGEIEKPAILLTRNELSEEQNDSLDINFGADEELFPENITSESVLDNINALIADLDNDIEAPKINDFNDKFINNIVGNSPSTESLGVHKTDFTADIMLNESVEFVFQDKTEARQTSLGKDKTDVTKNKNNLEPQNTNYQKSLDDLKGNDKVVVQSGRLIPDSDAIKLQDKIIESKEDYIKNNSDATVSTTAFDGRNNQTLKVAQRTSGSNDPANCLAPDSTMNTQEHLNMNDSEVTETCPDSTNECTSVINDDVTSTHITHTISKDKSNANSTCTDNVSGIDSIGKLLSLLDDKNKIKELLVMLGKDSGDNEKIKKKLEKLSEIVLDEEENSEEGHKDVNVQSTNQNEGQSKEIVIESASVLSSGKETFSDKKIHNVDLDEVKSVEPTIIQTCNLSPKKDIAINDEKIAINEQSKEQRNQENEERIQNEFIDENKGKDNSDPSHSNVVDEENAEKDAKNVQNNEHADADEPSSNANEKENENTILLPSDLKTVQKKPKKNKITKRGRSRLAKKLALSKDKRVTRSGTNNSQPKLPSAPKKPSRELLKLQEDIRDMFISDDILNATGIRMCRLAKMVNDKKSKGDPQSGEVDTPEPIVILENINSKMSADEPVNSLEKINKRKTPKSKSDTSNEALVGSESKAILKNKPGPKSKTKKTEDDPYCFETESVGESNNPVDTRDQNSDSESDSVSTKSFGSSELVVESKKKAKRKRGSWQLGVIKKKSVKNKTVMKDIENSIPISYDLEASEINEKIVQTIPDLNCFTDKLYCFYKNVKTYLCRLCGYRGNDIVLHYKKNHPHSEIPLSRLNPETASYAIQECENMNIQALSKIQMSTYVCRFCSQEFQRQHSPLESFFWHVVSVHTGEYKRLCTDCINLKRCPFNLDIPPPPKNIKGQLFGYICGRCNFTQVSLENLKTHVIIRHDDEQTEVYSINLSEIPKSLLKSRMKETNESKISVATCSDEPPGIFRRALSDPSFAEPSDDCSDITDSTDHILEMDRTRNSPKNIASMSNIKSKLIFENDDLSDTSTYSKNDEIKKGIKQEKEDDVQDYINDDEVEDALEAESAPEYDSESEAELHNINKKKANNQIESIQPNDVLVYPHFKIKLSDTGSKEYVCCINGIDNHYKTTLLISFKKHVQLKHSESWDGYCFVCKVIVTSQGKHTFRDCLQHFLDKHMDNFPIYMEEMPSSIGEISEPVTSTPIKDIPGPPKAYLNVRPLSELIASERIETQEVNTSMPKIQKVVSLGASNDPVNSESPPDGKVCNYEEVQAEIIKNKHRVVLEAMLSPEKLIHVFKCAGRFCSYSTNNPEEALLHATTHQKIGGENSLKCAYCDFDSSGNAIDLVMHVFKTYEYCSYSCSKCFYRGAVSQLVYAHIKRVHTEMDADKVPVLSSTKVVKDNRKDDFMSRDTAVLYYVCNNRDPDEGGICQFKSYVLTKFREHLQTKHTNDQEFSCYMCNVVSPTSKLLAQHLKSHGLRIYQCCRCLFGAENETELTAHASEKHPFNQPKAYLRIITSKGGSSDARVLPLAVLSKSSVETTLVTPSADEESPVKQAERSIDLEKLIGHTNSVIESMSTITNAATIEPVEFTANQSQEIQSEQASCSLEVETDRTSPATLTLLKDSPISPSIPTVSVKSEPQETPKNTNIKAQAEIDDTPEIVPVTPNPDPDPDVVCLDSDEDSSRPTIIDLSGDDPPVESNPTKNQGDDTSVKIPRDRIYKCGKCYIVSKSEGMFKRHNISCYPNRDQEIKCLYCEHVTPVNQIVNHYNNVHLKNNVSYICVMCDGKFLTLILAKKHMKLVHNETSTLVSSKTYPSGHIEYYISSDVKAKQAPKRKLSGDVGSKNVEPAHKMKKYGPQDIDKLPINPILDNLVYCTLCEFNTKVRLNMVRHLQMHAEQQPVSRTAPVNPVPHLESNEKHFDKMLNLAASSITTGNKAANKETTGTPTEHLSPEAAAIYPKYVSDRHRYTCGAKGCSYISVKESMFKIHWETLHAGTTDYHCVHCPPHQHLDTSKPLTAVRILTHLKMHDAKLYACSSCTYYHYTRKLIEKHLKEVHNGKVVIVREDGVTLPTAPPAPAQASTAPTMDLKPWQCGLCKFKSMLCPEVIEHCGKYHQSKMQFKCAYCGFRTSNIENVSKHQAKQHPGKKEEVFYFYYREGSIADEPDGTPRWQKQSQKIEPEIKTEVDVAPSNVESPLPKPAPPKPASPLNLDIVKKEVVEPEASTSNESLEDLCKRFGQFCEPNGLSYKCSLCKVIVEDTKEAMQSHLYEELQYRKWGCAVCSYKAFHKPGLQQHVEVEHSRRGVPPEPVQLRTDTSIEAWVAGLLAHQTSLIERNRENLAKQKAEILRPSPKPTEEKQPTPEPPKETPTMAALVKLFGPFGVPNNMNYTCPMCNTSARSEAVMQEHLESELNKRRWHCNLCNEAFQTYHEAQFHCRSAHAGAAARPAEAARGAGLRAAWVAAVLRVQKLSMNYMPVTEPPPERQNQTQNPPQADANPPDNSLLVVRYEEKVPTPEELMKAGKPPPPEAEKAPEPEAERKTDQFKCSFCPAAYKNEIYYQTHVLKHYGLKPFSCPYCPHTDVRKGLERHIRNLHYRRAVVYMATRIPQRAPSPDFLKTASGAGNGASKPAVGEEEARRICLVCEESMTKFESQSHLHNNVKPQFGFKGTLVNTCWPCLTLHKSASDYNWHHKCFHADEDKNTSFYKLDEENRSMLCKKCFHNFNNITSYRQHYQTAHGWKPATPFEATKVIELDEEPKASTKRKADDDNNVPVAKRVAKKSTTKLPSVMAVARKSTTKLPYDAPGDVEEYSFYGTRPTMDNLENVTTLMPFCNTFVPFTLKKLNEIIKIYPVVRVQDINDKK